MSDKVKYMKKSIIIGCDIGTGSCKAVAMRISGEVIAESQIYYKVLHPSPQFSEQDPEVIWNAFVKSVADVCKELDEKPIAISFSSCMHSLILMDKNHCALTPLITWEDSRSYKIANKLRDSTKGKKIYNATGTPIHSMSPLCKIAWYRDNRKRIFSKTAFFIGIKEYFWHRVFGTFQVDYSVASSTGLFNIHQLKWDAVSLKFCGIDESQLSELVPTLFTRKDANEKFLKATGLANDTVFCIGASDGCLANVGSGITSKEKAAITIGTSGAVRINSPKPIAHYDSMIFNYILDKKTFVCGGPSNNGGNVVQWLFKTFLDKENPSSEDFNALSKKINEIPPGSAGLVCLPFLYGERAPVWDEKASAMWFGAKAAHTRYHFIRAALEGICFGLKMILEIIEKSAFEIKELHVSGGFIHSKPWVKMLSDITGKKIIVNESGDASSIGAALWAMKALKISHPTQKRKGEIILPDKNNKKIYEKNLSVYKKLYPLTKDQMHLLF